MLVAVLAAVDTTQGTADVGVADVWKALTGRAAGADASVVVASRFPRAVAGWSSASRSVSPAPHCRR